LSVQALQVHLQKNFHLFGLFHIDFSLILNNISFIFFFLFYFLRIIGKSVRFFALFPVLKLHMKPNFYQKKNLFVPVFFFWVIIQTEKVMFTMFFLFHLPPSYVINAITLLV
jgi:hypothetical protein